MVGAGWRQVAVGACLGAAVGIGASAMAYMLVGGRGKQKCNEFSLFARSLGRLQSSSAACNGSISDCICRSVSLAVECLEESRRESSPLPVTGAIICVAEASGKLRITNMSLSLKRYLGHATYISQIIPASFGDAHALLVRRMIQRGDSPTSTMHPLVAKICTTSGLIQPAVVRLEPLPADRGNMYFAVLAFLDDQGGYKDLIEKHEEITVSHFGGSRHLAREYLKGNAPAYYPFERLTILFLDIKGFSDFVVSNSHEYVAAKLAEFHSTVATLLRVNHLWCIETRGDCYILVSGSNMVSSDVVSTQATRMLSFAEDLVEPQKELGLDVRIGIATGPANTFFVFASSTNVPILCTTGPTMVTAARLETSGTPHYAHMCSNTVDKLREEGFDFKGSTPTFRQGFYKGLPPNLSSAMWDCTKGVFCHV
jgi:class 3 adenylate cyclase